MRLTKNFTDDEFRCPCCGKFIDSLPVRAFLAKLQDARDSACVPFVITSGCRCPKHNEAVGGEAESSHLKGLAADISAQTSPERYAIIGGLIKAGFGRIGIGKDFVHVDMDNCKPQHLVWVY